MSPLASTWYRFVTNVLIPFLLPVGTGIVLVYVITPALANASGLPGLRAWQSLFSAIEILIIGLISAVGVRFEYREIEDPEVQPPFLLRLTGWFCAFLFLVAFLAYGGHVFVAVLEASPETAHIVEKPEDPWRSVPVTLTTLLVLFSMYIHWKVQRLKRAKPLK